MTFTTESRPAYTGERSKWTPADGTYGIHFALPTEGRTFLMDQTDDSPNAEFKRVTGKAANGMVGNADGRQAFLLHGVFSFDSDAEAVAWTRQKMAEFGDAISAHVFYVVPNEMGSSSELVTAL